MLSWLDFTKSASGISFKTGSSSAKIIRHKIQIRNLIIDGQNLRGKLIAFVGGLFCRRIEFNAEYLSSAKDARRLCGRSTTPKLKHHSNALCKGTNLWHSKMKGGKNRADFFIELTFDLLFSVVFDFCRNRSRTGFEREILSRYYLVLPSHF